MKLFRRDGDVAKQKEERKCISIQLSVNFYSLTLLRTKNEKKNSMKIYKTLGNELAIHSPRQRNLLGRWRRQRWLPAPRETVTLAQSSPLQSSFNWRSQRVAEKVSELLLCTARSTFVHSSRKHNGGHTTGKQKVSWRLLGRR